jgi:hypothetical protein
MDFWIQVCIFNPRKRVPKILDARPKILAFTNTRS